MHHSSHVPDENTGLPPFTVPVGNLNSIFTLLKAVVLLFVAVVLKLIFVQLLYVTLDVVKVKPISGVPVETGATTTLKLHVDVLLRASVAV